MDVQTMLAVFSSFGFETDDEMTEDRQVEALNDVYQDVCDRELWPFLRIGARLTFSAGGVPDPDNLPADIRTISTANVLGGPTVQPATFQDLMDNLGMDSSGNINGATTGTNTSFYYFQENVWRFFPFPAAGSSIDLRYYRVPADLNAASQESDILVPKQFHRRTLVMGTLAQLALMQDDPEMHQAFSQVYEKGIAYMVDRVMFQQNQQPDYIRVNDWDNYDYS